jgi:hypothetical protein
MFLSFASDVFQGGGGKKERPRSGLQKQPCLFFFCKSLPQGPPQRKKSPEKQAAAI